MSHSTNFVINGLAVRAHTNPITLGAAGERNGLLTLIQTTSTHTIAGNLVIGNTGGSIEPIKMQECGLTMEVNNPC